MSESNKKSVEVVAAYIEKEGKVYVAKRAYGELKGKWEFPGGKVKEGETKEMALIREIKEELNSEIEVLGLLAHIDYEYPSFFLRMDLYRCRLLSGELHIEEGIHLQGGFFAKAELPLLDWCPADIELVRRLAKE